MKNLLFAAVVCLVALPHSKAATPDEQQCDGNALQVANCENAVLNALERHLNAMYSLVMKMFDAGATEPDTSFFYDKKKDVVAAERAWLRFRDAQCGAEAVMIAPGSGTATVTGACLLAMTRERIKYLENLVASLKYDSKLCEKDADACRPK